MWPCVAAATRRWPTRPPSRLAPNRSFRSWSIRALCRRRLPHICTVCASPSRSRTLWQWRQATAGGLNLEPKAMRIDLGRRLPDDGQRHLRCRAKGGDVAIGQPVGIVLAAVLDLKVQPRAPAFAAHPAAVGFAGQVHPGAGAVLDPVAVDAERRVHIQTEALGVN